MKTLNKKNWIILILFGLVGQIAWAVENMYFNLFVFETIAPNLDTVTLMVQLSGIVATLVTLIAGTLSDKTGNRRSFISWGYVIWGVTVALFGTLNANRIATLFNIDLAKALSLTLVLVVVGDCVMTLFGSTANDAAFNAWVTDNTHEESRGSTEGVLSILPLLAMLIVAGGFGILVELVGYMGLFIGLGAIITICGVVGIFTVKDSPDLQKKGTLKDIVYGFKPSVVKSNPALYVTLIIMCVYGVSCQIFMPYLIIYMKTYLSFTTIEYSVVFGLAIVVGAIINLFLTRLSDKKDKGKMLYLASGIFALGLLLMFFMNFENKTVTLLTFGVAGLIMITGYILVSALCGALVRDNTPENDAGKLQGVRMIFSVLIPMLIGPMIGNTINKGAGIPLKDAGADIMTTEYIPAPYIFLAASLVTIIMFAVIPFLNKTKGDKTKTEKVLLPTDYPTGDIPHSEHPFPQRMRESWKCLNGKWQLEKQSATGEKLFDGEIFVPFSPETLNGGLDGNFRLEPDQTLVYKRKFNIEKGFNKGKVILHFGAVDSECKVFVNGNLVGEHYDGFTAFEFDITKLIVDGENTLEVIVKDNPLAYGGARGKQLKSDGIWYTPQSGIWQTVWLESMPTRYISDLKITTDAQALTVTINSNSQGESQTITVYDGEKEIIKSEYIDKITLSYPFELWSPESPKLYNFTITNLSGDKLSSYFGVRSFGIVKDKKGKARLTLNGKPYFYNGVLDQGYWSDGLLTYPSDKAIIDELTMLKDMGFNAVRKHIKIEPMRWYYHCDRLGLAVWQDFVSGGEEYSFMHVAAFPFLGFKHKDNDYKYFARENERGRKEFTECVTRTVNQLYNCVSICAWVIFNEGWGQFDSAKFTEKVKELDSTRIIDSVSGWHDQGKNETTLLSMHTYYTPLKVPKDSRPVVLSEFGGYSMKVDGHVFNTQKEFGYKKFKTQESLVKAIEKLYLNKLLPLIEKGLSACIYTQVSDVEEEINGLTTFDRKVIKIPVAVMKNINDKIRLESQKIN